MQDIEPNIGVENAQVDKQTDKKSCKSHQKQSDNKEPVRMMRKLAQLFFLRYTVGDKNNGDNKNNHADCIPEYNNE